MPQFPELVKEGSDPLKTFSLNYIGMIAPIVRAVQEVEALRQIDAAQQKENVALRLQLKAANDNLVSETTALRAQLKAANDNQAALERRIEWLEKKWARP